MAITTFVGQKILPASFQENCLITVNYINKDLYHS